MPDGSHPLDNTHEAQRRAARRVLRVARNKGSRGATEGGVQRNWWAGALAAPLLGLFAALWIQAQIGVMQAPGAQRAVDTGVGRSTASTQGFARDGVPLQIDEAIEIVAHVPPAPVEHQPAEGSAGMRMLRVSPSADLSIPDAARGLRMIDAVAGNPFGLRTSDVIVDLCDHPGPETALEISTALATDTSSCLVLLRDNALSRAELVAPTSDEAMSGRERVQEPEL